MEKRTGYQQKKNGNSPQEEAKKVLATHMLEATIPMKLPGLKKTQIADHTPLDN